MIKNKATRICAVVLAAYLLLGVGFYFIAGDSLHSTAGSTETVTQKGTLGEITEGEIITQTFQCKYDILSSVTVFVGTMARQNSDVIKAELLDADGNVLRTVELPTSEMKDNHSHTVPLEPAVEDVKNQKLTLKLSSLHGNVGNAVSFYYGTTVEVDTGRITVPVEIQDTDALYLNGERKIDDEGNPCYLCMTVSGTTLHWFGEYYWAIYGVVGLLLALYLLFLLYCYRKGKKEPVLSVILSLFKYNFLIRQLVSRDFKTKYKRSVLGMLWSFLNPLLTMSIQYVVFSTLFRSTIPNFVIYLLSGIICFNFFSEASNMCLMSIIGNATLINKVYVPKYIYPFSRTLSSGINLLLSLIPLLIMMLVTRTPITPAVLLLPFALVMLFLVSYGIGLILASMMVFFRDTQFLWGIFSMLLMYLTPIFYPENIIPAQFLTVYRLNPLYQVITFIRTLLIDGVSPEPAAYLTCLVVCLVPFLLGMLIFKKTQDKFVLNI